MEGAEAGCRAAGAGFGQGHGLEHAGAGTFMVQTNCIWARIYSIYHIYIHPPSTSDVMTGGIVLPEPTGSLLRCLHLPVHLAMQGQGRLHQRVARYRPGLHQANVAAGMWK